MRQPLLLSLAVAALSAADAAAQGIGIGIGPGGYGMPSEYPGYGIYAPGTSRNLSYGIGSYPYAGGVGPYSFGATRPVYGYPSAGAADYGRYRSTTGYGLFGRSWRR